MLGAALAVAAFGSSVLGGFGSGLVVLAQVIRGVKAEQEAETNYREDYNPFKVEFSEAQAKKHGLQHPGEQYYAFRVERESLERAKEHWTKKGATVVPVDTVSADLMGDYLLNSKEMSEFMKAFNMMLQGDFSHGCNFEWLRYVSTRRMQNTSRYEDWNAHFKTL